MSIQIHLEDGAAFEPGAEVRGRVEWQAEAGDRPKAVWISLLWHTEGKGTEDVDVIQKVELDHPPVIGEESFAFRLPSFPWSFSGTLLSLIWAIEASLEPSSTVERVNLVSAPGAEEIRLGDSTGT